MYTDRAPKVPAWPARFSRQLRSTCPTVAPPAADVQDRPRCRIRGPVRRGDALACLERRHRGLRRRVEGPVHGGRRGLPRDVQLLLELLDGGPVERPAGGDRRVDGPVDRRTHRVRASPARTGNLATGHVRATPWRGRVEGGPGQAADHAVRPHAVGGLEGRHGRPRLRAEVGVDHERRGRPGRVQLLLEHADPFAPRTTAERGPVSDRPGALALDGEERRDALVPAVRWSVSTSLVERCDVESVPPFPSRLRWRASPGSTRARSVARRLAVVVAPAPAWARDPWDVA